MQSFFMTSFRTLSPKKWSAAVISALVLLWLSMPSRAQGTVDYWFTGQVRSLNPSSAAFPGVSVASPVKGVFTIDYSAPDTDPSPDAGTYSSPRVSFVGTIGSSGFGSRANSGNAVRVVNGEGGAADWTILQVAAGPGLMDLNLTFYDSAGDAITGQTLPESAASFSEFADAVLSAVTTEGLSGQYVLDIAIAEVPEPAMPLLNGIGLVLLGSLCLRRRPGATNCNQRATLD
jgi:hypothetical protein